MSYHAARQSAVSENLEVAPKLLDQDDVVTDFPTRILMINKAVEIKFPAKNLSQQGTMAATCLP
jgi:hypothetical protein